jgi:DNA-binding NarL/FixJ family response regulator
MADGRKRLLIVEDDALVALDFKVRLEKMGYSVVAHAASAPEALDVVSESSPDLVLMDIGLGQGLDGIDAAAAIHEHFSVPIVFVTAHSDEATLRRAGVACPSVYVLKPVRDWELRSAIEVALALDRG